ncbi:MAG: amidohydrolase [Streptomycetales bacterium]
MRIDAIFTNGRFTTLDTDRPTASRIGVLGGRIAGVDEELGGATAGSVIDLRGAPVVPGFNDAHHHLSLRGQRLAELDLGGRAVAGLDEFYAKVAERAGRLPVGAWVRGSGYDQNKLGGHPTRAGLDAVAAGHPVWLAHTSGHMGVVNTAALAEMGFPDPATVPDVDGGTIGRDAGGLPDGLLTEQAQSLVFDVLRPAPFEDFVAGIGAASEAAAAQGLTSFTEPGVGLGRVAGNGAADVAAFQVARERGLLRQRATLMPVSGALHAAGAFEPGQHWFGLDLGLRTGFGDEWLRLGPVKVFSDGSLIGRTAAMRFDYAGEAGNSGFFQEPPERLRDLIVRAHAYGWQIATHAIGDRAVQLVLDAYEEAQARVPRTDVRHRIEHCGVASAAQVARIAALGVVPVPQGRFIGEIGEGMLAALGPDRVRDCYRQRSFLDAGITVPGSSDCPVVDGAPLLGIHDMVNQRTDGGAPFNPAEAVTPEQALRAYTHGSAYAVHEERVKGTLRRGRLADFAVLSDDPLAVAPDRIRDITVGATVVGGRFIHDAAGYATT